MIHEGARRSRAGRHGRSEACGSSAGTLGGVTVPFGSLPPMLRHCIHGRRRVHGEDRVQAGIRVHSGHRLADGGHHVDDRRGVHGGRRRLVEAVWPQAEPGGRSTAPSKRGSSTCKRPRWRRSRCDTSVLDASHSWVKRRLQWRRGWHDPKAGVMPSVEAVGAPPGSFAVVDQWGMNLKEQIDQLDALPSIQERRLLPRRLINVACRSTDGAFVFFGAARGDRKQLLNVSRTAHRQPRGAKCHE
jgi:hypothetical protein